MQKKVQNVAIKVCCGQKREKQQQQKPNIKIFARFGKCDLSHPSRMLYLWTTESTKRIDCCRAV